MKPKYRATLSHLSEITYDLVRNRWDEARWITMAIAQRVNVDINVATSIECVVMLEHAVYVLVEAFRFRQCGHEE